MVVKGRFLASLEKIVKIYAGQTWTMLAQKRRLLRQRNLEIAIVCVSAMKKYGKMTAKKNTQDSGHLTHEDPNNVFLFAQLVVRKRVLGPTVRKNFGVNTFSWGYCL